MLALLVPSLLAAVHGVVLVPLLWILGVVLLVCGIVALFRGSIIAGVLLIIVGILLGGLNVF